MSKNLSALESLNIDLLMFPWKQIFGSQNIETGTEVIELTTYWVPFRTTNKRREGKEWVTSNLQIDNDVAITLLLNQLIDIYQRFPVVGFQVIISYDLK